MIDDIETTYIVRVDDGRVVSMTGLQEDLHKILTAMKSSRSKSSYTLIDIDAINEALRETRSLTYGTRLVEVNGKTYRTEPLGQLRRIGQIIDAVLMDLERDMVITHDDDFGVEGDPPTVERPAIGALDLLRLSYPVTAGVAINEALRKLWPDRIEEREDVFDLARQYLAGCDEAEQQQFLIPFAVDKSRDRPYALAVVRRLTNIIYDLEIK